MQSLTVQAAKPKKQKQSLHLFFQEDPCKHFSFKPVKPNAQFEKKFIIIIIYNYHFNNIL